MFPGKNFRKIFCCPKLDDPFLFDDTHTIKISKQFSNTDVFGIWYKIPKDTKIYNTYKIHGDWIRLFDIKIQNDGIIRVNVIMLEEFILQYVYSIRDFIDNGVLFPLSMELNDQLEKISTGVYSINIIDCVELLERSTISFQTISPRFITPTNDVIDMNRFDKSKTDKETILFGDNTKVTLKAGECLDLVTNTFAEIRHWTTFVDPSTTSLTLFLNERKISKEFLEFWINLYNQLVYMLSGNYTNTKPAPSLIEYKAAARDNNNARNIFTFYGLDINTLLYALDFDGMDNVLSLQGKPIIIPLSSLVWLKTYQSVKRRFETFTQLSDLEKNNLLQDFKQVVQHQVIIDSLGCNVCGQSTNNVCGKCKKVYYCSTKCQQKDFPLHLISCSSSF